MTEHSVVHSTFVIERTYPNVSPAYVFKAWADPAIKRQWFGGGGDQWEELARDNDFRVGGRDRLKGRFKANGVVHDFRAEYIDIVPGARIIYAYDMDLDHRRISASLATIEFHAAPGGGTHLKMTEQGAFLDGYDDAGSREQGTIELMENFSRLMEQAPAEA